jgi:hypothetical protein
VSAHAGHPERVTEVPWPPDWRTARADALEATVIRLGLILVELDELEALQEGDLGSNPEIVSRTRELAAYVRARRNGMREEMERLRVAADGSA